MNSFEILGIRPEIAGSLQELGFLEPTEIQQSAIPILIEARTDLIGMAQTGTGKTAAFGLPIIQNVETDKISTQALVIAPTRELCVQICTDLKKYAKAVRNIRIIPVYGGSSIGAQIKALREGVHIVVATPGRLVDLIERKAIQLNAIRQVVLDEADEMLNMGFRDDMEFILGQTPGDKKTALFSATMSKEIREIASSYLNDPQEITVGKKNLGHPNITHQYAVVHAKDKLIALKRIVDFHGDFYGIVFCNTKKETQEFNDALLKEGYPVECIHGDLEQHQREKVMNKFRNKYVTILFATDVAARGIDVKNLTHIIHFHLPDDIENYTHRSGRTARAGQKGFSIALLHIKEAYKLHRIEKAANLKFERYLIPGGKQVAEKRIHEFIESIVTKAEAGEANIEIRNELVWPMMKLSKEQLVQIILDAELNKYNDHYLNAPDVNVDERVRSNEKSEQRRSQGNPKEKRNRGNKTSGSRIYINLGKLDKLKYDELREVIFKLTRVSGRAIRDIDMFNTYSFFMTDSDSAKTLLKLKGLSWKKRAIHMKSADTKKQGNE